MRIRITVRPTGERTNDLRIAANVRRDLWAHSPVEIDPDNPLQGTHRDERGWAYFEFSTGSPEEVVRVLREHGHADSVEVQEAREPVGQACQNCGNVAGPVLPTVCPNCGFRDVSPCPVCHNEVRFRFNEAMFLAEGDYNPPLVVVDQV